MLGCGCGAGVLSSGGCGLGIPRVVAVDIAWEAARITRDNAGKTAWLVRLVALQSSNEGLEARSTWWWRTLLGSADRQGAGVGRLPRTKAD